MEDQESNISHVMSEVSNCDIQEKSNSKSLHTEIPEDSIIPTRSLTYNLNQRADATIAFTHGVT